MATTVTGFSFDGVSYAASIAKFFGSTALPAHGTLSANLKVGNVAVPSSVVMVFTGRDARGAAWTRQSAAPFCRGRRLRPIPLRMRRRRKRGFSVNGYRRKAAQRKCFNLGGTLLHQDSAVHYQACAGDVAGVVGRQENRGTGQVFG